jgi:drug/metabolite transporter (DMT)-like permease
MTPTDTRPDARTDASAPALRAGTAYTLFAALGFAAVSTLTSIATAEHVSLWNVLMWRYVLGAVVMVAFVGARRYPRMPWREVGAWIAIGGGGQALFVGMALSSLKFITVATLAFLFYTYPAWVTLVQALRGAEPLGARRLFALALSFAGVVLIAGSPGGGGFAWQGVALALGAAMIYGAFIPTLQRMQKTHSVAVTSAYGKIGSAICFLLLAAVGGSFSASMTATAWEAILALAIFSTVLPSMFFLMGLMRLGPVRTAIVSTVEPFLTAVLGALVLRQPITPNILLGGAMIVSAVVVLQYRRERVA